MSRTAGRELWLRLQLEEYAEAVSTNIITAMELELEANHLIEKGVLLVQEILRGD